MLLVLVVRWSGMGGDECCSEMVDKRAGFPLTFGRP